MIFCPFCFVIIIIKLATKIFKSMTATYFKSSWKTTTSICSITVRPRQSTEAQDSFTLKYQNVSMIDCKILVCFWLGPIATFTAVWIQSGHHCLHRTHQQYMPQRSTTHTHAYRQPCGLWILISWLPRWFSGVFSAKSTKTVRTLPITLLYIYSFIQQIMFLNGQRKCLHKLLLITVNSVRTQTVAFV